MKDCIVKKNKLQIFAGIRTPRAVMVPGRCGAQFTLRLLEVKGLMTSAGMCRPGGHGTEKLRSRYLPLIASCTSLVASKAVITH